MMYLSQLMTKIYLTVDVGKLFLEEDGMFFGIKKREYENKINQ